MTPKKLNAVSFANELADLIKPLMECDMVWQDDLFEFQEKVCQLIAQGANDKCAVALLFTKKWPEFFETK